MNILPTFNGYMVVLRLKEFHLAVSEKQLEFIPFTNPEGNLLLSELTVFAFEVLALQENE